MKHEKTLAKPYPCQPSDVCKEVRAVLTCIGDKWTILVIRTLSGTSLRFGELRREIGGISQKMLTATLKNLERDGLITRTVTPTTPPRVDYALTKLGVDLLTPINALADWALLKRTEVLTARDDYERRNT